MQAKLPIVNKRIVYENQGQPVVSTTLHEIVAQPNVDTDSLELLLTPESVQTLGRGGQTLLEVFLREHDIKSFLKRPLDVSETYASDLLIAAGAPPLTEDRQHELFTDMDGKIRFQMLHDHALLKACSDFNVPGIKNALAAGADPNAADEEFGIHCLFFVMYSLENGEKAEDVAQAMKILVDAGANPYQTDEKREKFTLRDGLLSIEHKAFLRWMELCGRVPKVWEGFASPVKNLVRDVWQVQHGSGTQNVLQPDGTYKEKTIHDLAVGFEAEKAAYNKKCYELQIAAKDKEIAALKAQVAQAKEEKTPDSQAVAESSYSPHISPKGPSEGVSSEKDSATWVERTRSKQTDKKDEIAARKRGGEKTLQTLRNLFRK